MLNALSTEEITKRENALPAREGITPQTARAARTLLGTMLGDAASTKPPLIPYKPGAAAAQPRPPDGAQAATGTAAHLCDPLQMLLIAASGSGRTSLP
jgi:hypothetical protein